MATIVSEPDEMIGVLSHIPYHQQEVSWVLSNTLTKGQALSAHMEPGGKRMIEIKQNLDFWPRTKGEFWVFLACDV